MPIWAAQAANITGCTRDSNATLTTSAETTTTDTTITDESNWAAPAVIPSYLLQEMTAWTQTTSTHSETNTATVTTTKNRNPTLDSAELPSLYSPSQHSAVRNNTTEQHPNNYILGHHQYNNNNYNYHTPNFPPLSPIKLNMYDNNMNETYQFTPINLINEYIQTKLTPLHNTFLLYPNPKSSLNEPLF